MGTDYVKILQEISEAVGVAMGLINQGPAAFALAMKILEIIKTNPDELAEKMPEIHKEIQALPDMPYKEE